MSCLWWIMRPSEPGVREGNTLRGHRRGCSLQFLCSRLVVDLQPGTKPARRPCAARWSSSRHSTARGLNVPDSMPHFLQLLKAQARSRCSPPLPAASPRVRLWGHGRRSQAFRALPAKISSRRRSDWQASAICRGNGGQLHLKGMTNTRHRHS